jgi:hypothetical protein
MLYNTLYIIILTLIIILVFLIVNNNKKKSITIPNSNDISACKYKWSVSISDKTPIFPIPLNCSFFKISDNKYGCYLYSDNGNIIFDFITSSDDVPETTITMSNKCGSNCTGLLPEGDYTFTQNSVGYFIHNDTNPNYNMIIERQLIV